MNDRNDNIILSFIEIFEPVPDIRQTGMLISRIVKGGILAIDGKSMRGTADELNGKKADAV